MAEPFWAWNENNVIWDIATHLECNDREVLLQVLTDETKKRKYLKEKLHLPSNNPEIRETDDRIEYIVNKLKSFEKY